jgi:farnesol dehydrogenase
MSQPAKVFVAGATGFIGTKLVAELARRGNHVRALTRKTSNTEGLAQENVALVEGDILDVESLQKGMEGCQQVYHLAAYARNWARDPKTFFQLNVEGFRNVCAAAREAKIERMVYTSTIVTFGPTPPGVIGDENFSRTIPRYFTEYEESKSIAEQEALTLAQDGLPIVIVNPTRVYGPGKLTEGNSVTTMIDLYCRGRLPLLLSRGINVGNYVLVDDLVRGHLLAMEKGRIGQRYIIGGENVSLKQFFETVSELSGIRRRQFNLPASVARFYSLLEKKKGDWFGFYPVVTPGWIDTFLHDWVYSSAKAENELGYRMTPLREGLQLTYDWLLTHQRN